MPALTEPFVRPVRVPKNVPLQYADPPVAHAREKGTWTLRFLLAEDIPAGQEFGILFDGGRNVKGSWRPIQTNEPRAAGYVSISVENGPSIEIANQSAPGTIMLRAPDEGVKAGQRIVVVLGQGEGSQAPELSLYNKMFLLFVPVLEDQSNVPASNREPAKKIIGACLVHVIGNKLERLRAYAPSQAEVGRPFAILVRPEDTVGNVACEAPENVCVECDGNELPCEIESSGYATCLLVKGLTLDAPGVYRLQITDASSGLTAQTNPIHCFASEDAPKENLWWGMIHAHTEISDGAGTLDHYFTYMRDACFLDFGATGDHDHLFETSDEMWAMTQAAVKRYNEPGRFVTFLGYEWAKWRRNGDGDRNVYYLEDDRPMYRSDEGHYPNPPALFETLRNETAIVIPHHTAMIGNPCDWKDHDATKQRLVEIYSEWGCSERSVHDGNPFPVRAPSKQLTEERDCGEAPCGFVQRALEIGCRVGFTAGGDDHQGHPGDEIYRGPEGWRYKQGIMALYAPERTRESIWEALWNRRCYGTTGARMIIDFSVNGAPMGSELSLKDDPSLVTGRTISCEVHGTAPIEEIVVVRNNIDVFVYRGSSEDEAFDWQDTQPFDHIALPPAQHADKPFCFYYLRVKQVDGEMAWVSPVWID